MDYDYVIIGAGGVLANSLSANPRVWGATGLRVIDALVMPKTKLRNISR